VSNLTLDVAPPPLDLLTAIGLYELRFWGPYQSKTDPPSISWWLARRGIGGVTAEALAWARFAMATEILQMGFDETQIKRKSVFFH